ncbi:MAG: class I SAM-dependent methyltransferase [Candidatus Sungbacteria bacterium]|nr:class I SAM-dependent methyltransferase [Candidatus Sungbacteria bacterium]
MKNYTTNTACRMCKSIRLEKVIDLGDQPLANAFLDRDALKRPEPKYPLRMFFCHTCGLAQLVDIVDPSILFRDYVYFSSAMPRMAEHFRTYARQVADDFLPPRGGLLVELGSNDGILLKEAQEFDRDIRVLGVDPAENIAQVANERGIETIPDFFSERLAHDILKKHGPADAIIGNNVVAHINDHHDLIKGVKTLLAPRGVFVLEAPYLVDMFEHMTFDTIYHEHLSYLALAPVVKFFAAFGMEVFDARVFPVQGNSLRVYGAKKGAYPINSSVAALLARERELGLDRVESYHALAARITALKKEVVATLIDLKKQGKRIAGYGAPAKGNTLLNYYGVGLEILDYTTEVLPSKIGFFTPGMHIPVVDIAEARKNPPDYYFMLAWNYRDAILEKEAAFRAGGGKFVMPVGEPRII